MEGEGPAGSQTPPTLSVLEQRKRLVAQRRRELREQERGPLRPSIIRRWKHGSDASDEPIKINSKATKPAKVDEKAKERSIPSPEIAPSGTGKLAWWVPPLTRSLSCVGKRMHEERINWKFTVAIVGASGVGRSTLVHRFFRDEADDALRDYDGEYKLVYINGTIVQMIVETYKKRLKADGFIYLYDITDPESFEFLKSQKKLIELNSSSLLANSPAVLAGAKAHIADTRRHEDKYDGPHVSSKEAIFLAQKWECCFYELDCLDLKSPIDDVFYQALNSILSRKQNKQAQTSWCLKCTAV